MKQRKFVLLLLMLCLLTCADEDLSSDFFEPGDGIISGQNIYEEL